MSSSKKIAEFPDVEAKLQQPSKKSAFERQKAEAEAKRRREEAETAAVLKDFVKSFDDSRDDDEFTRSRHQQSSRFGSGPVERPAIGAQPAFGSGKGKRHFGAPLRSGPGSLGPPPPSFGKKRHNDGFRREHDLDDDHGVSGSEDRDRDRFQDRDLTISRAFEASDDEEDTAAAAAGNRAEEKAASRPTLRLANLPPGTSPAVIKALIPPTLTVENVRIIPSTASNGTERKSISAIVTLSTETPAAEIDAVVSALQNRYLGFGFFLNLHRHLSSAAIASGLTALPSSAAAVSHPFGAKRVEEGPRAHGPLPGVHGRGYAPPSSYGPPMGGGGPISRSGILHVPVSPPRDIKQLRMIHKAIESVLEHGPEFEALLMTRPDVQRDEKWSWIWDARSEGGIWYRWRLWEIVTGLQTATAKAKFYPLFEGSHAWKVPEQRLTYEYTTGVDEFVSDPEYDSSDYDDFEDEQTRQGEGNEQDDTYLNPIEKSKLSHLLARLPTTLSKIRKGDVARVTTFAITHASRGSDEIVDMIVSNIEQPFAYTCANPEYQPGGKEKESRGEDGGELSAAPEDRTTSEPIDMSPARLVGLYVVSDILSSSSTSGIRHAWRYRQLFETALRRRKTFEILGQMADKLNWGRLRADKWKRSVGLVLSLWEGWCVFPVEAHESFVKSFENPPSVKKKPGTGEVEHGENRLKPFEHQITEESRGNGFQVGSSNLATGQDVEEEQAERLVESENSDAELQSPVMLYGSGLDDIMDDLDLDGEPDEAVDESGVEQKASTEDTKPTTETKTASTADVAVKVIGGFSMPASKPAQGQTRKRMRAADMFAGSDSDSGT
ncbi:hypothetical protein QBC35DRAFT_54257 [Podospora australis]|uniref:CID domain-containing protein n=1 Tax=Podospora australis TaxID=1536484 RepID=A0AAN7AKQ3_9PEZI|nr:hypothetical protein QBC35DRAFT_54257 [Podospora australis]